MKLQRRVRFDTSGWIELWRGSASLSTALLPDLIYIQVPTVEVVASVFRVATCGATLLNYFTYCNILQHTQSTLQQPFSVSLRVVRHDSFIACTATDCNIVKQSATACVYCIAMCHV